MPYTRQASLGWSHEIMPSTVMTVDFVRADGRDLNVRPRINVVRKSTAYDDASSGVPRPESQRHRYTPGHQRGQERIHRAHHRV